MIVEQRFFIGMQDVGNIGAAANKVTNKALVEMLSNTATVHAIKVGQSAMQRKEDGMIWMVINWKLQVIKRPAACETVICRTWAQRYNRLKAIRDFEIVSEAGELLALATSDWVAVGPDRHSFVKLDENSMGGYGCEPEHEALPGTVFTKVREKDFEIQNAAAFTVTRSMIDANHHMHNTAYLDLANEVLPEDLEEACFDHVEINYRKEALLHDTLRVEYGLKALAGSAPGEEEGSPKRCIFVKNEDGSVLHTTILLY